MPDLLKNHHINCYQIVTNKRHIQRKRVICVSLEEEKKNVKQKKNREFFLWENKFWFFVVVKMEIFQLFSSL